ncbi:hypothetical protein [Flavobacterium piscisymbiosum]|uniref:Polyketide cyclase/dehydrase/lipid transport protein n=1 Tax=Flavobacterium piscisymbiosum TaxID=2893753 RepID=A0ABS8MHV9_9FLAO|nr:hypothetical protein [Flavobacterium sp. F-30]MCC9065072.1 hypothetical protein [Flavobacterium sp. F-30]
MKQYYGILFAVIYAMSFRILVEFGILEFNSIGYLIAVPVIMGYLPFLLDPRVFANSCLKAVLFPLISSFLFLYLAFKARLEDLGCLIILLPPYLLVSILISLAFRYFIRLKMESDYNKVTKNSLFIIIIPIIIGNIEKYVEKKESAFQVLQTVNINVPSEVVWNNLSSVPELTNYIDNSVYSYLGFPNPVRSEYNAKTNTRLGYFDNGVVLNEKIIELDKFKKMSFAINVEKSKLDCSQTFKHVLKNKNLVFSSITYKLEKINASKTKLTLVCDYKIRTNVPLYGEFWSKNIISDFESKLLNALKKNIEFKEK